MSEIVIVDDSEGDIFLAQQCLARSRSTSKLRSFTSGPAFLAHLEEIRAGRAPMPRVVLLDVNMPGMNGWEVLEQARSGPDFKEQPAVCMLTNSSNPRDAEIAKRYGADFVTKPNHPKDYVAMFDAFEGDG